MRARAIAWALAFSAWASAQGPTVTMDDYEQWRLSLGAGAAPNPVTIQTLPGFKVDVVRVAQPNEGSWISLAFDPKGRAVIGREDRGLLRMTVAKDQKSITNVESIEDTLLECRGLLFAHDSLYVAANNSLALYRLRDSNGDDRFDEIQLLKKLEGGVGHGRNNLALGPDGWIYVTLGNNVRGTPGEPTAGPYQHYGQDRLLPCVWNEFLFDADVKPPCGYVARFSPDGAKWAPFAGGFRNPYGLAFNRQGELFTYDADMEWDAGAPWYRATVVSHVVSGAEYGWRQGTSVWPPFFADSLPPAVDVGLGSPTGAKFGAKGNLPKPFQDCLFILDWAYGRILSIHFKEVGASYEAKALTFVKGKPLNLTDLDFGPDGALYFIVGGRKTQSALYRLAWDGVTQPQVPAFAETPSAAKARAVRKEVEQYHDHHRKASWEQLTTALASDDRVIQNAGRIALERLPTNEWASLALTENNPQIALPALLALSRVGSADLRPMLLKRLAESWRKPLTLWQKQITLRALELALLRLGQASAEEREALRATLAPSLPAKDWPVNYLLIELLTYLDEPTVAEKVLGLLETTDSQEQRLFYLYRLRFPGRTWPLNQRVRHAQQLRKAESFVGAQYLLRYLSFLRSEFVASLTDGERKALADDLAYWTPKRNTDASATRPQVKRWTLADLAPELANVTRERNREKGRQHFADAQCTRCHRYDSAGVPVGPDLDRVASRFGRRDLLDHVLNPSKAIDGKYQNLAFEMGDGEIVVGQLAGGDSTSLYIGVNPLDITIVRKLDRAKIVRKKGSPTSPMPDGLLDTLQKDEILDLLAYLEFGR